MAVPRRRFVPQDSSRQRVWVYLAVGAFLVLDVFLVVWALSSTAAADGATARPKAGPVRPIAPSPSASPSPSAEETPVTAVPPGRVLAALDATTAWRATTGPCPATRATPELTTDAGATWKVTDATGAGIAAVQDITIDSPQVASILGLSADDCSPQGARTFVAGDDYAPFPGLLDTAWLLDPAEPAAVSTPTGVVPAPCAAPVALAPRDDVAAAVLCADQSLHSTVDGGQSWASSPVIPGTINLAETDSGYIAVTAGARECAGVQVTQLDAALAPGTSGCLPLDLPTSTLPGTVAIAQADDTVWVWAGDRVWRSGDGGATWQ